MHDFKMNTSEATIGVSSKFGHELIRLTNKFQMRLALRDQQKTSG